MNCQPYQDMMMKYLDKDLNDVEFAKLKQHLKACQSCEHEFEEMKSIFSNLERDSAPEPPLNFEEQVILKIKSLDSVKNRNIDVLIYGIPILIIICLPVFLICSFSGGQIFDMLRRTIEYVLPFPGASDTINNIIAALNIIGSRVEENIIQAGLEIIKSSYDVLAMLVAVLVLVEWMFITLVKKSWRKVSR